MQGLGVKGGIYLVDKSKATGRERGSRGSRWSVCVVGCVLLAVCGFCGCMVLAGGSLFDDLCRKGRRGRVGAFMLTASGSNQVGDGGRS